ncbi:SWIM zinc finger-containing protein [Opitutaceae bacterium TAV1]|nr:SWIM zinc finger-containing protein [Opitutaceae bacterium TAV1]
MTRVWTSDQATSLAPDASSLKAAQGMASSRKWPSLGHDDDFIWGLAQGSGKEPYQVVVELAGPAFKCSCPSRKFPCKHGLGLLLLWAGQPGAVSASDRPPWVAEWASKRNERVAKQEARAAAQTETASAAPVDPSAQAKRREKRETNIQRGLDQLEGWMADLARQGMAAVATAGYAFWEEPARRLVDAQAAGLARRVRALGAVNRSRPDFEERATVALGRLHLTAAGYRRRSGLGEEWQAELAGQIGWTVDQEELRAQPGIKDRWLVAGQTVTEEERLLARATYLFGASGQVAQLLEFTAAGQPAVSPLAPGRWCEAELVFFPGVQPLRALLKTPPRDVPAVPLHFCEQCVEVISAHAARLAANPLAEPLPVLVRLTPVRSNGRWWLREAEGAALPVAPAFARGWELAACSGGEPLDLAGLWDGFDFLPLGAADAGEWRILTETPADHA